ncbi:AAA family ATPase [Mycoplasma corogypsi]|uniref:AAA family ATPase n=1 Tax=Mycoplasma corogypsi TaxID=2106 RepID=UPI0038734180
MKLIKVEAHGFKSFADPVILRFDGGVVGVIGPNGSGKSNINDAIRWVLGEQSSKELRGDSMQDVIFAGSATVKPMDKAEVTLTFDNSDKTIENQPDTISITRVLERGKGMNDYYLNGKPCRHKDIKAIAMQSGIGKSSLAIISQGTVSDIAESNDEQRRQIFEEAAGVSKYKVDKTEAERNLAQTEVALDKTRIKVEEMEKRLVPLRTQAEKALKFKQKQEELKEVEISYLAYNINALTLDYTQLEEQLKGVEETKVSYDKSLEDLKAKIDNANERYSEYEASYRKTKAKSDDLTARVAQLKVTYASKTERRNLIASGEIKVDQKERLRAVWEQVRELQSSVDSQKETYAENFAKLNELKAQNNQNKQEISRLNSQKITYTERKNKFVYDLNTLEDRKRHKNSLYDGVKTIVQNKNAFKGYRGLISEVFRVDEKYEKAMEVILSAAMQHIVVDKSDTAVKCIEFLKANNGGRATFIPLASIQEKSVRDDYLFVIRNHPGFIGVANTLVDFEAEFDILAKYMLGNIIVVDNIQSANKIADIVEKKYMIVTLDGDIVRTGGVMTGGSAIKGGDTLNLDTKIDQLKKEITGLELIIDELTKKISLLQTNEAEVNSRIAIFEDQTNKLKYSISDNETKIENLKLEFIGFDKNQTNDEISIDYEVKALSKEIINQEKQISTLKFDLDSFDELKTQAKADADKYQAEFIQIQGLAKELDNSFRDKFVKFNKTKEQLEKSRDRLTQHYKLTFEVAYENHKLEMSVQAAKEIIELLMEEIEALGNVNLESIQELETLEEEYNQISTYYEELIEAKVRIVEAIAEFDKVIVTRLEKIVADVNSEMHKVFSSMFGGGYAEVRFLDPKNVLESGIGIFAQPPGKTVKNLRLFSGGEKSLIAISLLFAILRARPLPLCILDEVEAALDESNVVRYAEYLQELKKQTQFIVITHRVGTMSNVDALFGATMQRRGVTSFFTVTLDDAQKMVEQFEGN